MSDSENNELDAIRTVHAALEPLDAEARRRILDYITSRLGIPTSTVASLGGPANDLETKVGESQVDTSSDRARTFAEFAELFEAADPRTRGEKALVAGFWLQECQGAESFTGAAANKELKDLGHRVSNITDGIDSMRNQKPALILQLRKSGSTRQARKLYKISREGAKRVKEMVDG